MTISRISSAAVVLGLLAMAMGLVALQFTGTVGAATPVHADAGGTCAGLTPCYTTIQEAVNNAGPAPAEVKVFPGTYDETVDLALMGSAIAGAPGDLVIRTVDASGAAAVGTATVTGNPADAFRNGGLFAGNVTIDGFVVSSATSDGVSIEIDGDVAIANVTSNNNSGNGFDVGASGHVSITNSVANGNTSAFPVFGELGVTMDRLSASNNSDEGIHPESFGNIVISNSFASGTGDDGIDPEALGDVTITNSTSIDSGDRGVEVDSDGNIVIDRLTATGNEEDSIHIDDYDDDVKSVTVTNSIVGPTGDGAVDFGDEDYNESGTYKVAGNVICGSTDGVEVGDDEFPGPPSILVDATANWWGSATGPTHPNNASGTGDPVRDSGAGLGGTINYTPWIDAISGNGSGAVQGQATVVNFQFTGGSGTVKFMEGPGDPNGAATFAADTDNGTVTTSGFAAGGNLAVTLTPATVGTATVTVTGPCGLDGTLGGNALVLDVAAAPAGQTTPVVTPVQLPVTGGSPTVGVGPAWTPWVSSVLAALAAIGAGAMWTRKYARRKPGAG